MLRDSARDAAQAQARVNVGPLPGECYISTPHATYKLGDDAVSILKREREAKRTESESKARCARAHDDMVKALR